MDDDIITTFDDEDFRAILNDIKAHMIAASTYGFDSYYDCLMDAGHAIEQLMNERDAAYMTNYERIKNMTVEEMADFLNNFELCGICAFNDKLCKVDEECHEGILTWLKQEARDGQSIL